MQFIVLELAEENKKFCKNFVNCIIRVIYEMLIM